MKSLFTEAKFAQNNSIIAKTPKQSLIFKGDEQEIINLENSGVNLEVQCKPSSNSNLVIRHASNTDSIIHITSNLESNATLNIQVISETIDSANTDIQVHNVISGNSTISQIEINTVLHDQTFTQSQGQIEAAENTSDTVAHLTQKTILVSDKCRSINLPLLNITGNDITASHSAATYRLTPEELFYINSRGLDDQQAQDLLIKSLVENPHE